MDVLEEAIDVAARAAYLVAHGGGLAIGIPEPDRYWLHVAPSAFLATLPGGVRERTWLSQVSPYRLRAELEERLSRDGMDELPDVVLAWAKAGRADPLVAAPAESAAVAAMWLAQTAEVAWDTLARS